MHILLMDLGPADREKKRHLAQLAALFQNSGNHVPFILCREGSHLQNFARQSGLDALTARDSFLSRIVLRLKLGWRLRNNSSPWVLQCFDPASFALALRLARKKDHVHVVYAALSPECPAIKKLEEKLHLVSAVITSTREIADKFAEHGFLPSRMFTIYNCIDASEYEHRQPRGDGRTIFACSDSLERGYGYDTLTQALSCLLKNSQMPPWELRIAGGGALFDEFLEQAVALGVDGRIAIFGKEHGADILKDCDILVAPSGDKQAGLAIKEGWASGLPVVCADAPGNMELVEDGANGVLFEGGNPESLAEKMHALAVNEPLRRKLAQAGFESLENYGCDAMLQKHLEVFSRISKEYNVLESADI